MAEESGDDPSARKEPDSANADAPDSEPESAVTRINDQTSNEGLDRSSDLEPAVTPVDEAAELEPAVTPVERRDAPEESSTADLDAAWGIAGEDDDSSLEEAAPDSGDGDDITREQEHESAAAGEGQPAEYEPPEFQTEPPPEMEPDHEAPTDGGYADDATAGTYEEFEPGGAPIEEGAPDDEEMPLADHIEEMVRRLGVVIVVMAIVSGITFPFGADLINFLWFSYLPGSIEACPEAASSAVDISEGLGGSACPRVYHPLALVLARLKVATLAGFVVALPVFVYETYLFMRPGLYPHERRYYLASVPTSLVLAGIGVLFAHLLVLPALFTYFLFYSDDAAVIAFGLSETFDLITLLLGGFAFIFQIPLFVMLALMMGLVTRRWMTERRLLFWGAFGGLAFLFSPDPTGMAPIIVAVTMIVLFEGTLLLARWTGRG